MRRIIKTSIKILLALALLGVVVWGFLPKPLPVELAEVKRGYMRVTVDEDGKTRLRDRYVVSAPISGQLKRVELKAGDPVPTNRPLVTLEPSMPVLLDNRSYEEAKKKVELCEAKIVQALANQREADEHLIYARRERDRVERLPQ